MIKLAESATGKKPQTVAIIKDNTAAPVASPSRCARAGCEKLGLKLVVDETFTPPLSDCTPLIQKVRSTRPGLPAAAADRDPRRQALPREDHTSSGSAGVACR